MSPFRTIKINDSKVTRFQKKINNCLINIFGEDNVKYEWDVSKEGQDALNRCFYPNKELYCPRLDIAVGSFNIDGRVRYNINEVNRAAEQHIDLLRKFWEISESHVMPFEYFMLNRNKNPRCLLAIEIENSGSSKHMIGNIANASIMGSIGIVIPFSSQKLSLCRRIKNYNQYVTSVEKIEKVFQNVLIIKKEKFLRSIN